MTTATLIPGPPVEMEEWSGDEEEAFLVFVSRQARDTQQWRPCPLVMNWGEGTALIMFSDRELAERFVASPWFQDMEKASLVKGTSAEKVVEVLGVCLEHDWVKLVMVNPNPFHEWAEGKIEGDVVDAAELHEGLSEAYSDFLDD
jgi:hypothetical protein